MPDLKEAPSIDSLTDSEIAETLQAVAERRDDARELVCLVYYKNGTGELFPTNISIEREAFLLQILQEHLNNRIRRAMDEPS